MASGSTRGRTVKVADGVKVMEMDHKAKKLIRVRAELIGEKILGQSYRGRHYLVLREQGEFGFWNLDFGIKDH